MKTPQIFNKESLVHHVSQPTIMQTRQAAQWNQMVGLDPQKLARIIKSANDYTGLVEYFTLLEELEERDGHVLAIMGNRKRAVCGMEITVKAAEGEAKYDEHANLIHEFIERDDLDSILFDIMDAVGKGYSMTEIIWETSANQWMPKSLERADQRLFSIDKNNGRTLRLLRDANQEEDLLPFKFIAHYAPAKSGSFIRGGVLRPCMWMSLFKNYQLKDWVIFNEAYNQPMRVGKYHAGASDDEKRVLLQAVHSIGADAAAIIPENMQLEFIEAAAKSSSEKSYKSLIDLCDTQCSKAVLGQTTTTDAISGGHAVSKEHNEVREDIAVADAKKLAATLNDTIVKWIIDFNYGVQTKYPKISIGLSDEIDQEQFGKNAERGQKLGLKMSARGVAANLGLPLPEDKDDILGGDMPKEDKADNKKDDKATANKQASPCCAHHATASKASVSNVDEIEKLSDEMSADYEDVMNPVIALLQAAANKSSSYDEFNQNLLEIAGDLDMTAVAEKIRDANFTANIAGQVDAEIEG